MSEYETEPLDAKDLATLVNLAEQQFALEEKVALAEERLKELKRELRSVAEHDIPDLMGSLGIEKFRTTSGLNISISKVVRCSVPAANRAWCWDWLDQQGHGGLIKRTVSVAFNRDQENEAHELVRNLEEEFPGVKEDKKVEPATLRGFIREQLEQGVDFPMERFGATQMQYARVRSS